jgi:NitT/TauT family transport system permease protein
MGRLPVVLRPNAWVPQGTYAVIAGSWIAMLLFGWFFLGGIFPTPSRVAEALRILVQQQGLLGELFTSLTVFAEALLIAAVLSMCLAYLSAVPAVRPVIVALTKARFMGMVGLTFVFTLIFGGGHPLKVSLLVFGISAFFLTGMVDVVNSVKTEQLDHARTLRMGEWRVLWEVVILGQMHQTFDALRQNAAIGWMMLTMVEGIARSEGGIGTMLMDQNKHFHLAAIVAVQAVFLIAGFFQDLFLAWLKGVLVPHAALVTARR